MKNTDTKGSMKKIKAVPFMAVILSLIFVLPLVNAKVTSTVLETQSGGTCFIEFPKIATIKQLDTFDLNFHVFNLTGAVLNNSMVSCVLHLYDNEGHHIYINKTPVFKNNYDFSFVVPARNISKLSQASYIMQCNNTGSYGCFVSEPLEITPSGFSGLADFYYIFIIIIIATVALGLFVKNPWIMMLGSIMVLIFGFFVIIYGVDIFKNTSTTWAVGLLTWALGVYFMYLSLEEMLKEGG